MSVPRLLIKAAARFVLPKTYLGHPGTNSPTTISSVLFPTRTNGVITQQTANLNTTRLLRGPEKKGKKPEKGGKGGKGSKGGGEDKPSKGGSKGGKGGSKEPSGKGMKDKGGKSPKGKGGSKGPKGKPESGGSGGSSAMAFGGGVIVGGLGAYLATQLGGSGGSGGHGGHGGGGHKSGGSGGGGGGGGGGGHHPSTSSHLIPQDTKYVRNKYDNTIGPGNTINSLPQYNSNRPLDDRRTVDSGDLHPRQ